MVGELRLVTRRRWRGIQAALVCLMLAVLGILGSSVRITRADPQPNGEGSANARATKASDPRSGDWQVTVFGILETPREKGESVDPRLGSIKNQLRKLIPADRGFKLLDVRSDRLSAGQTVHCDLGKGRAAQVTLIDPLDSDGKVKLRCEIFEGKKKLSLSEVANPLNQLFFCEHTLQDGTKLLLGVGAR